MKLPSIHTPSTGNISPRLARRTFVTRTLLTTSTLGLAAWVGAAPEARADAKDVLAKIAAARADLRTLFAKFRQTRRMSLLESEVKSTGELSLVRPDRLRWELYAPDAVTYWVIPEGLYVRGKEGKVSRAPKQAGKFGAVLRDLLIIMGDDLAKLEAHYTIEVKRSDGPIELVLWPKSDELKKSIARVALQTDKELWALRKVTIEEAGGDESVIEFEANQRNVAIDPTRMKPPA